VIIPLLFIVACGKKPPVLQPTVVTIKEPVEVIKVVPQPIPPPPELLQPLTMKPPTFISPSDPTASSALDAKGERDFRAFIEELAAWRESVLALWRSLFPALFP
jgi:hypothetical protein